MKKFILKTCIFVVPFILLYFINYLFYDKYNGDLARLGYFYTNPLPKNVVTKKFKALEIKYTELSDTQENTTNNYDILTIGDSFSEQHNYGYKNYLAVNNQVLHINRFLSKNQVQTLIGLANGDFFDRKKTKFVVLQIVERYFTKKFKHINTDSIISTKFLFKEIAKKKDKDSKRKENQLSKSPFFSKTTLKAPLVNLLYNFNPNGFISDTYKVKTSKPLFSNNINNLLFTHEDLEMTTPNNSSENIKNANRILNIIAQKLHKKGIKLILLISPDKYDIYYNYIENKKKFNFKKPLFFNLLNNCKKDYIFIPSKEKLAKEITIKPNIYYYDDTHWSPIAAQIIANEIENKIRDVQ